MEGEGKIESLIARKLSGELSDAENQELKKMLENAPEWRNTYKVLSDWWDVENKENAIQQHLAKDSFDHISETVFNYSTEEEGNNIEEPSNRKKWINSFYKWAAIFIVGLLLGGGIYLFSTNYAQDFSVNKNASHISEVSTRYGSKSKITLPDGTLVWLNSGSKLVYNNEEFGIKNRTIKLIGEGFFDVAQDANIPFVIHTDRINIKVLGTAFDVKAYPEDDKIEATLIRGSIKVSSTKHPDKTVILKPQQKVTVFKDDRMNTENLMAKNDKQHKSVHGYKISPITVLPTDSVVVETSWVQNKLAFNGESFADLSVQMERWYNVKINFSSSQVKQYKFTGIFVDESLQQALKALQITAAFNYKIENGEVYISSEK